jgi:drug/metabolite transporter (DMT)-like permease
MKTYVVLTIAILAQATGNVILSMGMKSMYPLSDSVDGNVLVFLSQVVGNPTIWLGTMFLILFFVLFAVALSWEDLSFVMPFISIEIVVNVMLADYFLNEPVTSKRWLGAGLIAIGVVFLGRTRKKRMEAGGEGEGIPEGIGK